MRFNELTAKPIKDDGTEPIIKDFVQFAIQRLGLPKPPSIKLIRNPKQASDRKSFGGYMPGGGIEINIGNRHIMDVCRTLAHELVHYKQDQDGVLGPESGKDGSEHENEANAKAAVIMRLWGKMNPELFQHASILAEAWSNKYKRSINCANPKGFSQRAHCQGRKKDEDYHPNDKPAGPEFKPTMPKGTVKVNVSDVYDWYKLGKEVANLKNADKSQFGKGAPETIFSFGSEDEEHKYIQDLMKLGLTTTDVDPGEHKPLKGQKFDRRFNVSEKSKK